MSSCNQLTKKRVPCKNKPLENGSCSRHQPVNEKFKDETCCVCTEGFTENFKPLYPCGHYIHIDCVCNSGKDICPMCKTPVKMTKKQKEKTLEVKQRINRENMREYERELIENDDYNVSQLIISRIEESITSFINELATCRENFDINVNRFRFKMRFVSNVSNHIQENASLIRDIDTLLQIVDRVFLETKIEFLL